MTSGSDLPPSPRQPFPKIPRVEKWDWVPTHKHTGNGLGCQRRENRAKGRRRGTDHGVLVLGCEVGAVWKTGKGGGGDVLQEGRTLCSAVMPAPVF